MDALDELRAVEAIKRLNARYLRSMDTKDRPTMRDEWRIATLTLTRLRVDVT